MYSKELLVKHMSGEGIAYSASDLCRQFLTYFKSDYAVALREASRWVAQTFESYSDAELQQFMNANLGRWGAEFNRDSLLRGNVQ